MSFQQNIKKPEGKLGILTPGIGAVSTTFMAGVLAARKGIGQPFGSISQLGKIRLGKRTENREPKVKDFVPLASLDDLVFGGWDIFTDNAYEAALNAGVLDKDLLEKIKDELSAIKPMPAVFDPKYVKRLHGTYIKKAETKMDLAKAVMADIENFKTEKIETFITRFKRNVNEFWDTNYNFETIPEFFDMVETQKQGKCVLIIDEVEGINKEYFGTFLHSIRNAYHSREKH